MRNQLRVFNLCLAALAALAQSRCTCSGNTTEPEVPKVDTIIVGADTVLITNEVVQKPVLPEDSTLLLDKRIYKSKGSLKKTKVYYPAPPFPKVDTASIITDSIGRKLLKDRLCIIITNQNAGASTLNKWEKQFKTLFPDSTYCVTYKDPFAMVMQIAVPSEKRDSIQDVLQKRIKGIKFAVLEEEILQTDDDNRYTPNDPVLQNPFLHALEYDWYFDKIQAREAWDISKGNPKVVVAIVDDYFDLYHPELYRSNIVEPYSVVTGTRNVLPPDSTHFHGTMVASLALGNMDNKTGACGIAPNCSFMPISIGDEGVTTSTLTIGILRAIHSGADVVNVSWGWAANFFDRGISIKDQIKWSRRNMKNLETAFNHLYDQASNRNCVIVFSAGNERDYIAVDPKKRSDNIICVSSVGMDDEWSKHFSNVGNFKEYDTHASTLSAPGEFIFGALPNDNYQIDLTPSCGTSYSAPLVTGAVALMKSIDNSLTNKEIISILQRTGRPAVGKGANAIGNIIQIGDALQVVKDGTLSYRDFLKNPIGLWMATEQSKCYKLLNEETGEVGPYSGQIRLYYRINSLNKGYVCGEQIVCQVTDVKRLVHWEMKEPIYLYDNNIAACKKNSNSENTWTCALTALSYGGKGFLSDGTPYYYNHGFWGNVKIEFYSTYDDKLCAKTTDRWGGRHTYELKRCKKTRKEYKAE